MALDTPGVTYPAPKYSPRPNYTAGAMARKVQGVVSLEAIVEADGSLQRLRVVRSLDDELDLMAVDAVRSWRFRPARRDGRADPVPRGHRAVVYVAVTSCCYNRSFHLPMGGRSTVGHVALDHVIGVRIPASQPIASRHYKFSLHRFDAFDSAVFFVARTERRPGGAATRHELSALALAKVSRIPHRFRATSHWLSASARARP